MKQHLWSLRRCWRCASCAASLLLLAISILSACGTSQGAAPFASPCPTMADANASGIITVDRTLQKAGPVAFDFGPYTLADRYGAVRWSKTFGLDSDVLWGITPLVQHVVVFHGMMYRGTYDNVLPAACGAIQASL